MKPNKRADSCEWEVEDKDHSCHLDASMRKMLCGEDQMGLDTSQEGFLGCTEPWESEDCVDIHESPVLRAQRDMPGLDLSPLCEQAKESQGSLREQTLHCSFSDLVSLHSFTGELILATRSGASAAATVQLSQAKVTLQVSAHCPSLPPVEKSALASSVSCSIGESAVRCSAQAYISQLENELFQCQSQLDSRSPVGCVYHSSDTDWEQKVDEAIARCSRPNRDGLKSHNRVKSAIVEVKRVQTTSKQQLAELSSALLELKRVTAEYQRAASAFTTETAQLKTEVQSLQRQNRAYTEKLSVYTSKLREAVFSAAEMAENVNPLRPLLPLNIGPEDTDPNKLSADIKAIETKLQHCSNWEKPKLEVRLSLLRNQELRVSSQQAIAKTLESSKAIENRTAALQSFLWWKSSEPLSKIKIPASTCTSPRKNESFASFQLPTGQNRGETSFKLDLDRLDRSELDRGELSFRQVQTSRNLEVDTTAAKHRRKMTEIRAIEDQAKAEQTRLSVLAERLTAKERELSEKEEALMHCEQSLLKDPQSAQALVSLQEKYRKLQKLYSSRSKKAGEEWVRLQGMETALRKREMRVELDKEELKQLVVSTDERIALLQRAKAEVMSLCCELQGLGQ